MEWRGKCRGASAYEPRATVALFARDDGYVSQAFSFKVPSSKFQVPNRIISAGCLSKLKRRLFFCNYFETLENLPLQLLVCACAYPAAAVSSGDGNERRRIKKAYLDAWYVEA
jgi:hypothetical protein